MYPGWQTLIPGIIGVLMVLPSLLYGAEPPVPSDRVDALRRSFRQNRGNDEAGRRKALEALSTGIKSLRSTRELYRAMLLQEWQIEDLDPAAAMALDELHEQLAVKLEQKLRASLKDGDRLSRMASIQIIGAMGKDGVEMRRDKGPFARRLTADLIPQLKASEAEVRIASARALGQIDPDPKIAIPALEELLKKDAPAEQSAAADGLANMLRVTMRNIRSGDRREMAEDRFALLPELATEVLRALGMTLADTDAEVRRHAQAVLELAASVLFDAVGEIPVELQNGTEEDRKAFRQAYEANWKRSIPLQRALSAQVPRLVQNLKDQTVPNYLSALHALEKVSDARAHLHHGAETYRRLVKPEGTLDDLLIPGLRRALPELKAALSHKEVAVQLGALYVLEPLGVETAPAIGPLCQALRSDDPFVRWGATRVLRQLAPAEAERAVPALAAVLGDDNQDIRLTALLALRRHGPSAKTALDALIKAVGHKDAETRISALEVLAGVGKEAKGAESIMIAAVSDLETSVRLTAIHTLERLGPLSPKAIDALQKAMNDSESEVRQAACDALLADK